MANLLAVGCSKQFGDLSKNVRLVANTNKRRLAEYG